MPKFTTSQKLFYSLLGSRPNKQELEQLLTVAKAELDEFSEGSSEIKIELNDTNRPDLWSVGGLTRQLRTYQGQEMRYPFFSTAKHQPATDKRRVTVDENIQSIRPYIAAFEARGNSLSEELLVEIIDIQERLCSGYGRKRRSVAMGIYRADILTYPLRYYGADPERTSFVPLDENRELTLRSILAEHPKGQEYGEIIAGEKLFPLIVDYNNNVLSMPPIINSAVLGAVQIGDSHLFVELTGDDQALLYTAANIVACDLADFGFEILPVTIDYPYQTPLGTGHSTPYNFHTPMTVELPEINKRLGRDIAEKEAITSLRLMGVQASGQSSTLTVDLPPWRNDYMHSVDVCEDIMIGLGLETFSPAPLTDFTIGTLLPLEALIRKTTSLLVGLGFQEMIHHYLVSSDEYIQNMYPPEEHEKMRAMILRIANPRSEQHDSLRNSIIPSLLQVERASAHAVLPHYIFEIGKVAHVDASNPYGSRTTTFATYLAASNSENFTACNDRLSAIFYYLDIKYSLKESSDPRFIEGRQAVIIVANREVGILGELHPQVLENWHIQVPITCCEFDLERIRDA